MRQTPCTHRYTLSVEKYRARRIPSSRTEYNASVVGETVKLWQSSAHLGNEYLHRSDTLLSLGQHRLAQHGECQLGACYASSGAERKLQRTRGDSTFAGGSGRFGLSSFLSLSLPSAMSNSSYDGMLSESRNAEIVRRRASCRW